MWLTSLELGELMCIDALDRNESCGGHFRTEYQTEDGEALRDDDKLRLCSRLGIRKTIEFQASQRRIEIRKHQNCSKIL